MACREYLKITNTFVSFLLVKKRGEEHTGVFSRFTTFMSLYHLRYLCLTVAIFTLWGTCFACWSIWKSVYVVVTVCICNVHHTVSTSCLPLVCIMCIVIVLLADYANRSQVQKARRTELSVTAGITFVVSRSFVEEQFKSLVGTAQTNQWFAVVK